MKVIFLKDLKKQAKKNEIKEVSDGYATNYLIKNGYAVKYTKSSSERLDTEMKNYKLKEEENIKEAMKIKEKIEKEKLVFKVQEGKGGKVFGSISSKQICEKLNELGYSIDKKMIVTKESLSCLGSFYVEVVLYKKVIAKIKVELIKK
ncbi:MAG: 50S ribosomal protein L9 [Bacilli bacterium]